MRASDDFAAMLEAGNVNYEEIARHGSLEMQTASRMLICALATEIPRQHPPLAAANGDSVLVSFCLKILDQTK